MDQFIIGAYLIGVLLLGMWAGRGIRSISDYSVAGRSFGWFAVFATMSASFIGGGFSMGNAEKVYLIGIANIVALWGFSFQQILVAATIAPRIGRFSSALSVGDIMETRFGKAGKIVAGIATVMICAGTVGVQVKGIGIVFDVFLGIDQFTGILIGCGVVIAYSTFGGMRAVVFTDLVQFVVLAVAIPLALYLGVEKVGGIGALMEAAPEGHFALPSDNMTWIAFISLFLTFFLGETLAPPYVQRLLIGKTTKATVVGNLLSGLFSIPFLMVTGAIGLVALALNPGSDPNSAMPYVINEVLPAGVKGIAIAAILSIVMSSADSFLNSASIGFTHDILKPVLGKPLTPRAELRIAQVTTLLVGVLAVVFALKVQSMLGLLLLAYDFYAPVVLPSLALVLLGVRLNRASFIAGLVAGVGSSVVWKYALGNPAGIDGLIIGTAANFTAIVIAHNLQPKTSRADDRR